MHVCRIILPVAIMTWVFNVGSTQAADPGIDFFEQKIRPVLIEHCYSCHSEETKRGPKGEFRIDNREVLRAGNESGPGLMPGKPTESLVIKVLKGDDDYPEMPPKGKLDNTVIADFEKWIEMGAPDPRDGQAVKTAKVDIEAGRQFWAYQLPKWHEAPDVRQPDWAKSEIDRFILAKLEEKGLKPANDASREKLVRRITVDLTGLLPTPKEVDDFVNDPADDDAAIAKLVDRLLDSPQYGERWGRHWLDLARYADSNGKDENLVFHEAYLYRDYVIRSFNEDKPFNRFAMEQIGGDLLPYETTEQLNEHMIASGFLIVGPKVLADRDKVKRRLDVIDEQIEAVGKAFLAQTLGCARCHDHKFDPIPQADYYALSGILGSTRTLDSFKLGNPIVSGWMLRPLGGEEGEKQLAAKKAHDAELKKASDALKKAENELKTLREQAPGENSPNDPNSVVVDDEDAKLVGSWKKSTFSSNFVGVGYIHDDQTGKGEKSVTFTPDLPVAGEYQVLVAYTPGNTRANNVPVTVKFQGGSKTVTLDQTKPAKVNKLFEPIGTFAFVAGQSASVEISNKGTKGHVIVDAVQFKPVGKTVKEFQAKRAEQLKDEKKKGPDPKVLAEAKKKLEEAEAKVVKLKAGVEKLKKDAPKAPPMVMAAKDEDEIQDSPLYVRGNPHQPGEPVARGFLQVAHYDEPPTFPKDQSGRRELAEWVASDKNPLTARVWANRVWGHLFGEAIVRTVDNFGTQGERPSHPELLDTLAVELIESGWSTKQLIRKIITSRTYRLSVEADPELVKADPENRLFGHANRRRVEAEVIRDGILQVARTLDMTEGGPVVSHLGERAIDNNSKGGLNTEEMNRRSVYLPVIRNDLPQMFEVFDFADPDVTVGKRDVTTVATQALYLMNGVFIQAQSKNTAQWLIKEHETDLDRLNELFRLSLSRLPTEQEQSKAEQFMNHYRERLASLGSDKAPKDLEEAVWTAVCQSVFGCTEFRFLE